MLARSKKLPEAPRAQGGARLRNPAPGELDWEMPREDGCFRPNLCPPRLYLLTAPERGSVPEHGHPGLSHRCPQVSSATT